MSAWVALEVTVFVLACRRARTEAIAVLEARTSVKEHLQCGMLLGPRELQISGAHGQIGSGNIFSEAIHDVEPMG